MIATASYGYFRLRDEGYQPARSRHGGPTRSARTSRSGKTTFVYFKHEEEGKGPEFARQLMDRLGL